MNSNIELTDLIQLASVEREVRDDYVVSPMGLKLDGVRNKLVVMDMSRYTVMRRAHKQISNQLEIPWQYYERLTKEHQDLLTKTFNSLVNSRSEENADERWVVRIRNSTKVMSVLDGRRIRSDNFELIEVLSRWMKERGMVVEYCGYDRGSMLLQGMEDDSGEKRYTTGISVLNDEYGGVSKVNVFVFDWENEIGFVLPQGFVIDQYGEYPETNFQELEEKRFPGSDFKEKLGRFDRIRKSVSGRMSQLFLEMDKVRISSYSERMVSKIKNTDILDQEEKSEIITKLRKPIKDTVREYVEEFSRKAEEFKDFRKRLFMQSMFSHEFLVK